MENQFSNLNLNVDDDEEEEYDESKGKIYEVFNPTLIEFTVISTSTTLNNIYLPCLKDFCKLIKKSEKSLFSFDKKKYSSFFDEKNQILNLKNNFHIQNTQILKSFILFIGGINDKLDISSKNYLPDSDITPPEIQNYFENSTTFQDYLEINKFYILNSDIIKSLSDFKELILSLEEMGFKFKDIITNSLYRSLKEHVMALHPILLVIAPSNNLWIKSEQNTINEINYDRKLNNFTNIFYNHHFIPKFFKKIVNHPRCHFAIISSMIYKNIRQTMDSLKVIFNFDSDKKILFFDQKLHINLVENDKKKKPIFVRSLTKIKEYLTKVIKAEEKYNDENILFLDSEEDKIKDTENNTIKLNLFSEQILSLPEEEKEIYYNREEKAIDYIYKLFENCSGDIREYLKDHPLIE